MRRLLHEVMGDYLTEQEEFIAATGPARNFLPPELPTAVPIRPASDPKWEIVSDPNRLMRTYEFQKDVALRDFVVELLGYQTEVQHHAKLTVDHLRVIVEVHTQDVDDVTELDTEYAKVADMIYLDVLDYEYSSKGLRHEY